MKTTSFVATALAVGSASAQIPPSDFEFPVAQNQAPLLVSYPVNGSTLMVEPGILFGAGGKYTTTRSHTRMHGSPFRG